MRRWDPRLLALTCLGLGHLRPAPGTWGSLPSAGLAWLLLMGEASAPVYAGMLVAVAGLAGLACVAWGDVGERAFGRKDARPIVADEVAGQALALLPLNPALTPAGAFAISGVDHWLDVGLVVGGGFLLFRAFDILKPPPARTLERHPAGWGVLLDDLVAGLYAAGAGLGGLWALSALGAL